MSMPNIRRRDRVWASPSRGLRLAAAAAVLAISIGARSEPPRIAVLPLQTRDVQEDEALSVESALTALFQTEAGYRVVPVERVLAQMLQSGYSPTRRAHFDPKAAGQLGKLFAVKKVVTGGVSRLDEAAVLRLRIVDVSSTRFHGEATLIAKRGMPGLFPRLASVVEVLCKQPEPSSALRSAQEGLAELMKQGKAFEASRKWAQAVKAYQRAVHLTNDRAVVEARLDNCRTHHDMLGRYSNPDFRQRTAAMSMRTGLDMLQRVLDIIGRHYVEIVDLGPLLAKAAANLRILADMEELAKYWPSLREANKRAAFLKCVDDLERAALQSKLWTVDQCVQHVMLFLSKNRQNLRLPDGVLLTELLFGLTRGLDRYSLYVPTEVLRELEIETEGRMTGIGAEVARINGVITVVTPIKGGPASAAGILPDDRLLRVGRRWATDISVGQLRDAIRGAPNTAVKLALIHAGADLPTTVAVKRRRIELHTVRGVKMIDEKFKIGYVRVRTFQRNTAADLTTAIRQLQARGMRGLILDLRGNPGGLLDSAVAVSDLFLDSGVIVSIKGRYKRLNKEYRAKPSGTLVGFPLVILVNSKSASASEIVASATRHYHRSVLVGARTVGKASVQGIFSLQGGRAAFNLTIARYFPPSGVSFDGVGIEPDEPVLLSEAALNALDTRWRAEWIEANTGKPAPKSICPPCGALELRDLQLDRAVEVLRTKFNADD